MTFPTPTNATEMHSILKDIFHYYRIKKAEFEQETLYPIVLTKLDFQPLDDANLKKKASDLLAYQQQAELSKIRLSLQTEIDDCNLKIQELTKSYNQAVENITEKYNKSALEIQEKAIIHGVAQTSTVTAQLVELESNKNNDLTKLEQNFIADKGYYLSKIDQLSLRSENLSNEYSALFQTQITQKFTELKDEQDKLLREVFKYNNGLDEKEQRSKNSIAQANATLQLKYMEISSENFSKDQLIDMGYYQDVINCVCAYYDTLAPLDAWRALASDDKCAIYLEEYYTQVVYMYQQRANAG